MRPTGREARNQLRAFVRAKGQEAKDLLTGRAINDLTMTDLAQIAAALNGGINPLDHADDYPTGTAQEDESAPPGTPYTDDKGTDKQLAAIRDLIVNGGFTAADATLRKLISDANKPAELIEVPTTGTSNEAGPVTHARPTTVDKTWSSLFGVRGELGKRTIRLWDGAHPDTPVKDDLYVWPSSGTSALTQIAREKNVFFWGPKSTGKTSWAEQLAATLGRPFALISCDDQTEAPTLVGMTVPKEGGGTKWQDGILTRAIQTPGCVVCIDEPSVARAGALMVFQNVLQNRVLYIAETGRRVPVARGVIFIACDNTNGTGGGMRHGYAGTGVINGATMDRFGIVSYFDYLPPAKEARVVVSRTKCTQALAELLVSAATTTRQAAKGGTLTNGISLRRLLSWAELLTDGIAPQTAFTDAVLNLAPEQDREALTQQCLLTYDKAAVAKALGAPDTTSTDTTDTDTMELVS